KKFPTGADAVPIEVVCILEVRPRRERDAAANESSRERARAVEVHCLIAAEKIEAAPAKIHLRVVESAIINLQLVKRRTPQTRTAGIPTCWRLHKAINVAVVVGAAGRDLNVVVRKLVSREGSNGAQDQHTSR